MTRPTPALRAARSCYGHLAGQLGIALRQRLEADGLLQQAGDAYRLTAAGHRWAASLGLATDDRNPLRHARCCLDWTEKQPHLGARLGADILLRLRTQGAVVAGRGRALQCAEPGDDRLWRVLGLSR